LKQARADLEALFESDATLAVSAKDIEDIQLAPELAALLRASAAKKPWRMSKLKSYRSCWISLRMPLPRARRPQSQNFRKSCPTSYYATTTP